MKESGKLTVFKEWHSLTGAQQWAVGALVTGAVINILVYALLGTTPTFYSVMISTTAAITLDRVSRFSSENRTMTSLANFELGKKDLHFIGYSTEGQSWISKHSIGLRLVENTICRSFIGQTSFNPNDLKGHVDKIKDCINAGCIWRDIVLLKDDERDVESFFDSLSDRGKSCYSAVTVANFDVPLFQMMIFYYDRQVTDQLDTVLFGWAYPGGRESLIFESHDTEIIKYLSGDYHTLYEKATPLYTNGKKIN
jgi:hypothetical protein